VEFQAKKFLHFLPTEQILRTIPSGLFLVDREQRIVLWNAEAERITGFSAAEAVGRHCSFLEGVPCGEGCGLYSPDVPKPLIGAFCKIKGRDGQFIYLLKNVDYLRNANGEVIGGIESFIDITQRTELERELRSQAEILERTVRRRTRELEDERSRLRAVLDGMTDFAYITTQDFRIDFMNRSMQEVFGPSVGEACHATIYGEADVCSWCPMPEVSQGETVCLERHLAANGRMYEVIHTPLRDADDRVQKLAVFRDITERKVVEEKLREANRELDAFAYTLSHDLRTALSPILGFADLLRTEYGDRLGERGNVYLEEIETQGEKILELMEDLLALARVGWVEPPAGPVDVESLVLKAAAELRQSYPDRPLRVKCGSLPGLRFPASLVTQLFSNLLSNAQRYGNSLHGPIEIGGREGEGRLEYYVLDHGPGIAAEERERVFELFYRGTSSSGITGTGIGLATVRKIVRLYGGRSWVTETPGGGCTFWVDFPAEPQAPPGADRLS